MVPGPNGAGKSTFAPLGSRIQHPSSSKVTILNKALRKTNAREIPGLIGIIDLSTSRRFNGRLTGLTVVCPCTHQGSTTAVPNAGKET